MSATPTSSAAPSAAATTATAAVSAATPAAPSQPEAAVQAASDGPGPGPFAIVEASGQQFWMQPDRYLDIDRLNAEVDSTVSLDTVLLVRDAKGTSLGAPYVKGATVTLKVLAHRRGPKVIVYKMRPKKKTRRKNGHRQELTRVLVTAIEVGGKAIA
jgi:large subunit ribosomal protein L21